MHWYGSIIELVEKQAFLITKKEKNMMFPIFQAVFGIQNFALLSPHF